MRRFILVLCLSLVALQAMARDIVFELETGVKGQNVVLASELSGWKLDPYPHLSMRMRETRPGFYELRLPSPWLERVQYKFVVNGSWMNDPLNPLKTPDGHGGFNSILEVSEFEDDPLLKRDEQAPEYQLSTLRLTDWEGASRQITVALPPARALRHMNKPVVAVYFHDGHDYLEKAFVTELFANLSVRPGMPAFAAVFIPPKARMREYDLNKDYARFVARQVVPEVESRFGIGGSPKRRLLVGASMGGLITVFTAIEHNDVFRLAASQSGSFWKDNGRVMPIIESSGDKKLKLFLDVGTYEHAKMYEFNLKARDALERAGHQVVYREYPSTHDWIGWRNRLRAIMEYFFK